MSRPKEPYTYGADLAPLRALVGTRRPSGADGGRVAATVDAGRLVGEASTLYASSPTAVSELLADHPHARLVLMVRDPVRLARSFHGEMRFRGYEDEPSFTRAWALQEARREDPGLVPRRCPLPRLLQYGDVAALGTQLQRLHDQAGPDRVLVLFQEDLAADPRGTYRAALDFLGVADDGRETFPAVNVAKRPRWPWLNRVLLSAPVVRSGRWARSMLPDALHGPVGRAFRSVTRRPADTATTDAVVDLQRIAAELAVEVDLLGALTGRDLGHWGRVEPPPRSS
ncbi:sulfotransferase [Salsipaludibacter albus]|uniref:sulfotransferase n=1 Tax=Salsipaludibacter albus TaxID=2849650 RepID=UPI001EE4D3C9|nr:sulfotransferase [Salsipaludibacter albus]MBY5163599.1 sulfotransferase [Salsipaludibacter albus]